MYEVAYTSLFPHISTILEKKMHSSKVLNIISIFSRFAHIYSSVKKQILTTILTTIRARTEKIYGLFTTKNVNYRNKTC